jgi:hypothetical protein
MAMTNKSLLAQYKAAVKAAEFFEQQSKDKDDPDASRWMSLVHRDSVKIEHTLRLEIRRRGLRTSKGLKKLPISS